MAVRIVQGNLLLAETDTLVNPVNCIGVQGAGLARQFRDRFPGLDAEYRAACRSGRLRLGSRS
ncbi:MAG: macro domain-containing protein [Thermomicrobiales bacterium]